MPIYTRHDAKHQGKHGADPSQPCLSFTTPSEASPHQRQRQYFPSQLSFDFSLFLNYVFLLFPVVSLYTHLPSPSTQRCAPSARLHHNYTTSLPSQPSSPPLCSHVPHPGSYSSSSPPLASPGPTFSPSPSATAIPAADSSTPLAPTNSRIPRSAHLKQRHIRQSSKNGWNRPRMRIMEGRSINGR